MANNTKNIMIVGVGGQGTLLTSRILGGITVEAGYDVKLSEVHFYSINRHFAGICCHIF